MNDIDLSLIKNYVDKKVSSGLSGKSAYQIAVDNGFSGTEQQWLASMDVSGKENTSNKVTSLSSSSTNTQYPSAKLVYDQLQLKQNANSAFSGNYNDLTNKPTIPDISGKEDSSNKTTSLSSSSTNTQYPSAKAVYDIIENNHISQEQIEDILETLYPEATAQEIEEMVNTVLDNLSTVDSDMIEAILSSERSGGGTISLAGYALLHSPAFTGTPTAPTASYGTNTNQIATTAFVHAAMNPHLLVSIQDVPQNVGNITVTITLEDLNEDYSETQTLDSSGIASFSVDYLGTYSISYNNPQIKSNSTIDILTNSLYTLSGVYEPPVTYTLNIDKTNTNPLTCCTYADDALDMTKGSSDWDSLPIFKDIRPCVLKNGEVQYYLNPSDWTLKMNGDSSNLTGTDGDVMIEFPKFAYKIKTTNNVISVSISTDISAITNDNDYTYDAFSRITEGDLDYFYKGAFKGYIDGDGKLRSIAGVLPTKSTTISTIRTAAQTNGAHYQQSTYAQLKAIQCLYLIKYGSLDGQTALGNGNTISSNGFFITGYNSQTVEGASSSNSTLGLGMCFGNDTRMRLFGIEDFWGNLWEWTDGITSDASRNLVTSWNSFSNETGVIPSSVTTTTGVEANLTAGYTSNVVGNTAAGFACTALDGSSTTYWTDEGRLSTNCVLNFGGRWTTGTAAGPFAINIINASTKQDTNTGGRLSYV